METIVKSDNDLRLERQSKHLLRSEKLTGHQTDVIAVGDSTYVYQGVSGRTVDGVHILPRAIRYSVLDKGQHGKVTIQYVVFEKFDETLSVFFDTYVHWTMALDFARRTGIWLHRVSQVVWSDGSKSYAKITHHQHDDTIHIDSGSFPSLQELPATEPGQDLIGSGDKAYTLASR